MSEFDNYKPNSNKSRAESAAITSNESEKRATKVVTNPVKVKKNELRKVADALVPGDVTNIKSYIFMDVLVPAFKKLVSDIITNSVDMLFYGETGRSRTSTNASRVSYRNNFDKKHETHSCFLSKLLRSKGRRSSIQPIYCQNEEQL